MSMRGLLNGEYSMEVIYSVLCQGRDTASSATFIHRISFRVLSTSPRSITLEKWFVYCPGNIYRNPSESSMVPCQ